jgi:multiple sugar transport system permease protein
VRVKVSTFVFVAPALILVFLFLLLPVGESLYMSFLSNDGSGTFVGLKNFSDLFSNSSLLNVKNILRGRQPYGAIVNNLLWIALHLPLSMGLGFGCALILIDVPKISFVRSLIFIGMVVPGVIIGVVTQFMFDKSSGMVSNFFGLIGVKSLYVSWFSHSETALLALILTSVWTWTGYSMIVFLAALTTIPPSFIEAATIDGASGWQILWRIKVPLLKKSIQTVVVMSVIMELTSFDIVYSSTYGGPGGASSVMGLQMYFEAFKYSHFSTGTAIATLMTLMAAVPIYFNVRNAVRQS